MYFFFTNAELRDQIVSVQEEKKILAIELENLKSKLVEVIEEVRILGLKCKAFSVFQGVWGPAMLTTWYWKLISDLRTMYPFYSALSPVFQIYKKV